MAIGMFGAISNGFGAGDVTGTRCNVGTNNVLVGDWATITGGEQNTILSGQSVIAGGTQCKVDSDSVVSVIAGGQLNLIGTNSPYSSIGGGLQCEIYPNSRYAWVGGGSLNEIEEKAGFGAIGGGHANLISSNAYACTIAGGYENRVGTNAGYSTIGGGFHNIIGDLSAEPDGEEGASTISGGWDNSIEGGVKSILSTICGGAGNRTGANSILCTIAGGGGNVVGTNAFGVSILGGSSGLIRPNSTNSVILGGSQNIAGGNYSLAAGFVARAEHTGTFVWADASDPNGLSSTSSNQFIVRSAGGIWFGTNSSPSITAGHLIDTCSGTYLSSGGMWTTPSDRNKKENFKTIDCSQVLQKVSQLPLQSWNYKAEDKSVRHIGPMAQDFAAAFSIGEDDRHIGVGDEAGVALAAIQGLNDLIREKDVTLRSQEKLLQEQSALVRQLSERLQALEETILEHKP